MPFKKNQWFPRLFKPDDPVRVHEPYKLSEKELADYRAWSSGIRPVEICRDLRTEIDAIRLGIAQPDSLHIVRSPSSNAIILYNDGMLTNDEFHFLIQWLSDQIRSLGYRTANSDRLMEEKRENIETRLRIYLKPRPSDSLPLDQKYGNILLELHLLNRDVQYMKMQVSWYSDRSWTASIPFDSLLDNLLKA